MKQYRIDVQATSAAPPAAVWALLSDVNTWPTWAPFDEAGLERPGTDDPNGLGAIRRFRTGRRVTREEVVGFEPVEHFAYALLSGVRARDYRADVTLTANASGGTDIAWRSSFEAPPGAGWLTHKVLERFVRATAVALAAAASERSSHPA
jgi:hypothetical protein